MMVSVPQLLSISSPSPLSFSLYHSPPPLFFSHAYSRPPVHTSSQPRRLSEAIPGPTTPSAASAFGRELGPQDRPRSNTHSGFLRRESSDEFPTYDKRRHNKIRGLRIRKVHVSTKIHANSILHLFVYFHAKVVHVNEELYFRTMYIHICILHTTLYIQYRSIHNKINEHAGLKYAVYVCNVHQTISVLL